MFTRSSSRFSALRPRSRGSILVATLMLAAFGLFPVSANAADVSYDLGFFSNYIWRGITVTDDPVFQPAVSVSHESGFGVSVWGNLDMGDANDLSGDFNEVDLTLNYGWGSDSVSYEVGLIEYLFPNGFGAGTREVYFSLGFDVPASPSVAVYYDFDEVDDFYATFGLEHGVDLTEEWALTFAGLIAYAGEDFAAAYSGGTDSGFHDWNASVALDYSAEAFSFGVLAAYTDSVDDKVLTQQATDFWGGVYFGFSF